ncbi:MAG: hypothetical protein HC897_11790 [Thermoanaerobaculia bacterium]|nr:hypothetical protein [Thermoanaerobaculia bacterium]
MFAGESPRLSQLLASPAALETARAAKIEDVEVLNPELLFPGMLNPRALGPDPLRQTSLPAPKARGRLRAPLLSFEGVISKDNADLIRKRPVPPDANGDVSPDHYIQMTNNVTKIFDKDNGELVAGPFPNNLFFAGTGSFCEEKNDGDPIVLYDHQAKRWIFTQLAFRGRDRHGHQCFAISQTRDPLGAYFLYEFVTAISIAGGDALNDYGKLGVWPDGLYYSHNEFELDGEQVLRFAAVAIAFDKKAMYAGDPDVRGIKFVEDSTTGPFTISLLPTHWEGKKKPRAGAPNLFWQALDEQILGDGTGVDGYRSWAFHADFKNPTLSTFIEQPRITAPAYNLALACDRNCFDQPPPGSVAAGNGLDEVGVRLMYRAQLRSFGGYESVVLNHTVNADGQGTGGIRWVELRDDGSGFRLFQTGTLAPADGNHRFMGSIAQDRRGNIALGYSVTGLETTPRCATRGAAPTIRRGRCRPSWSVRPAKASRCGAPIAGAIIPR